MPNIKRPRKMSAPGEIQDAPQSTTKSKVYASIAIFVVAAIIIGVLAIVIFK